MFIDWKLLKNQKRDKVEKYIEIVREHFFNDIKGEYSFVEHYINKENYIERLSEYIDSLTIEEILEITGSHSTVSTKIIRMLRNTFEISKIKEILSFGNLMRFDNEQSRRTFDYLLEVYFKPDYSITVDFFKFSRSSSWIYFLDSFERYFHDVIKTIYMSLLNKNLIKDYKT